MPVSGRRISQQRPSSRPNADGETRCTCGHQAPLIFPCPWHMVSHTTLDCSSKRARTPVLIVPSLVPCTVSSHCLPDCSLSDIIAHRVAPNIVCDVGRLPTLGACAEHHHSHHHQHTLFGAGQVAVWQGHPYSGDGKATPLLRSPM